MSVSLSMAGSASRIFKGAGAIAFGNVAIRLLALLTMPILTRILSPSAYGTAALLGTAISLATVIGLGGLDVSYARAYFAREGLRGVDAEREVWRLGLRLALSAALLASVGWIFLAPKPWANSWKLASWVFFGVGFSFLATLAQVHARLRGKYTHLALALFLAGCLGAFASLALALSGVSDERPLLVSVLIGYAIPMLMLGMDGLRLAVGRSAGGSPDLWPMVKVGLAGVLTAPLYWLVSSSDRWFLAAFQNASDVGIYSLGYSVASLGLVVNVAVGSVWLPECARLHAEGDPGALGRAGGLAAKVGMALLVTWAAVAAGGGDAIRFLAGPAFHGAAQVVPWIAAAVLANGWLQVANAGLILEGRLYLVLIPWVTGGLLCVVLNVALVPRWGIRGAAITQAISFFVIAAGTWVMAQRAHPMQLPWGRLGLVCGLVVVAGILMSPPWSAAPLKSLGLKLPVLLAVVGLMSWIAVPRVFSRWAGRANP